MQQLALLLLIPLSIAFLSPEQADSLSPKPWEESEVHLIAPGIISTEMGEYSPTYDAKRNELYFMRRTPGIFDYTIYKSTRVGEAWTNPEIVSFSGDFRDAAPYLSPDGNTLLFDSRRPHPGVKEESINLWYAERTAEGWGEANLLISPSKNASDEPYVGQNEYGPAVDDDGKIYFYSFRRPYRGGARYSATYSNADETKIDPSIPDPSANTFVSYLYVSPEGDLAIMEGRAAGRRDGDLFCSCKKTDGTWTESVGIPGINTTASEGGPFITSDGEYLLFTSNRPTKNGAAKGANLYLTRANPIIEFCRKALQ